jgi:two-component system, response regulator PdtaR
LGSRSAVDQATKDTPKVVLIVEDEPIVRMSISHALLQAGFEVLTSSNGAEALELIAVRPLVFAVVSDIAMPGSIDGFELAREVQRRWPGIGIVLVSGQMEPPKSHCPAGVLFLSKPFKASTLLRLLRDIAQYPPKAVSEMWLQFTQNHGPLLAWAILALVVALPPALDSADIKSRRWAEFYGDRLKAALKAGRGINVAPQQL